MPPSVNAAAATLAVYIFRLFEVSLVYLPAPPRLPAVMESLDGNQRKYRVSIERLQSVENRLVSTLLIFE
jgi:hypothetical protein